MYEENYYTNNFLLKNLQCFRIYYTFPYNSFYKI